MNNIIFLVSVFSILFSQNIDLYFSLIDEGELDGVKENLPELLSKYPNDPGVLFLKATLTNDGESALKQYKYILQSFPKSTYAPESAMKIGEYFYARGLYTQSATILKNIPIKYYESILGNPRTSLFKAQLRSIGIRQMSLVLKARKRETPSRLESTLSAFFQGTWKHLKNLL